MIHAKTDGSPLFMADVVRYLRDSGSLVERDGDVGAGAGPRTTRSASCRPRSAA